MALQNRATKSNVRSRARHTRLLKNKLSPGDSTAEKDITGDNIGMKGTLSAVPETEGRTANVVTGGPAGLKIKRSRQAVEVEQDLSHSFGPNKPILEITLKLTTALRGQRKHEGLVENGYLFRLEVVHVSPDLKLAGFQLGPWSAQGLDLDQGAIYIHPPLWAGFQARSGPIKGRVLLQDLTRHRLVDLPWKTEALVPGPETLL